MQCKKLNETCTRSQNGCFMQWKNPNDKGAPRCVEIRRAYKQSHKEYIPLRSDSARTSKRNDTVTENNMKTWTHETYLFLNAVKLNKQIN